MKHRAPRKKKKQAKRLKALNDAFIMTQAAVSCVMTMVQVAHIAGRPNPTFIPTAIVDKAIDVAQATKDGATAITSIMAQIKTWQHFVKPKMTHL